ncbi:MAG: hypothetical protein GY805_38285 [Chloroflexi bacterium]|nr:hypothetical protein [Chloroflexota bacterium]
MSAYFGIILIAELLLGARSGAILGALSIAITGWMILAADRGWLPPPPDYATVTTYWIEFSTVVVGVVALTSLVVNSLKKALARARHNEKELAVKVTEVQVLAQKAMEANVFKSQLIARISHELRTPLGALMGMAEMLEQDVYGPLTPEQKDITARIINNSHDLQYVFIELLDQVQIDSGQLIIRNELFSIQQITQAVHEKYLLKAQSKGLTMMVDIDPRLPKMLSGDKRRIKQILSNLVVNAIKFTKLGKVMVTACHVDDDHWALRIEDTGIGIPEEIKPHIFEPFRQADESVKRKYGGVGLGLSIVQQLVSAMNGSISLESTVGKGSMFNVILPLQTTISNNRSQ